MKSSILIFLIVASMTAMHAQKIRIDTLGNRIINTYFYEKGGDSLRQVMKADDKVLQSIEYYRNGQMREQTWARDSQYTYDVFGKVIHKLYGYNGSYFGQDNSIRYFANGQIFTLRLLKDGVTTIKEFSEKGELRTNLTNFTSKNSYFRQFQTT